MGPCLKHTEASSSQETLVKDRTRALKAGLHAEPGPSGSPIHVDAGDPSKALDTSPRKIVAQLRVDT
ncbi:hypothetical protein Ancab_005124, partial [Ancistrocladus abbreviatus]